MPTKSEAIDSSDKEEEVKEQVKDHQVINVIGKSSNRVREEYDNRKITSYFPN
jgi:hypothetical protein